jgi:histidinol dehydrogenase
LQGAFVKKPLANQGRNKHMKIAIRQLDSTAPDFRQQLDAVLAFEAGEDAAIDQTVVRILADVKARGDAAVLDYTNQFDRLPHDGAESVASLEISQAELHAALTALEPARRAALETAAERVRAFHLRQKQECGSDGFLYTEPDGTVLGQKITPLDRVGIYVPGGKAAYPSSVLMNAIPAKVAGVSDVVMVVPTPGGVKNAMVLAAAAISGVDRVFTIGGAQAVAALAYGTRTIPQVDKIVGPGNAYVAAAKRRVFGTVGIDMIAGPSEILIICDGSTPPDWIAMDLFSQAEHDELAQSILLCPDATYLAQVEDSINRLLSAMPRHEVIRTSLQNRGALVKVRDMEEACAIANLIAAEHLEISTEEPLQWVEHIRHAGAMFLGRFSSEALGDYCAGPNHVLPTSRTARFSSPLGVYDFQKRSSIIQVSQAGAQTLGRVAAELAYGEGLQAHARSAEYRLS